VPCQLPDGSFSGEEVSVFQVTSVFSENRCAWIMRAKPNSGQTLVWKRGLMLSALNARTHDCFLHFEKRQAYYTATQG